MAPVARAIAWLARRGLLYTDVRPPNVLVEEEEEEGEGGGKEGAGRRRAAPRVHLVDFDDVLVLGEPVASAGELCALLREHSAFAQMGACPALLAELMALPWP